VCEPVFATCGTANCSPVKHLQLDLSKHVFLRRLPPLITDRMVHVHVGRKAS
jgi:hypothetical protein